MTRIAILALLLVVLEACTVGPRYQRPSVTTPEQYYNNAPGSTTDAASLGDEKWWALFQDPQLQALIRTGLSNSYDVQIAASRILQAQAQVGLARSQQFPTVSAGPGFTSQRVPGFSFHYLELQAQGSWDVDFWGKYRRATEAARANLVAAEWNRREVISTLVSNIAVAYFEMRELDSEREISNQTLASRRQSLELTQTLANGGAAGMVDVRQAEQLVETAAETIPDVQRQIGLQEDLLSTLAGENPHAIPRGLPLTEEPAPPEVPAGVPSRLLERRPDVRAAEQQLAAATANIGVARAAFFPSLPLTGTAGIASGGLVGLFSGPSAIWTFTAPLTQPIFTAGRLKSNLQLTEAQQQETVLVYRQAIQTAFRQVSNALISYRKNREFREHQELLTAAAQDAARLSDLRYRGGATSYLEVLTSQTNYFSAQLNLAR
ncbi:MAG: efflux transporter outer membrane subunit, partial [Acidobacteriaceae bacterium]|nr:efflux transporter outer membrane subunit [Acidobacteriaceae bacterium]